jgi:DNA-binding beta-propeller fold protein YncE
VFSVLMPAPLASQGAPTRSLLAESPVVEPRTECNAVAREPIVHVSIDGRPFGVVVTRDGCWVYVSVLPAVASPGARSRGSVGVFRRSGGVLTHVRSFAVVGAPTGMVLTRDETMLIIAAGDRLAFLDARKLRDPAADATVGYLVDTTASGRVYVNVTADDRYLFVSDERSASISVIDLDRARRSSFDASATIGKIPTGRAPIALTFDPGERYLYTTSQAAPPSYRWPLACIPAGTEPRPERPVVPSGAVIVVDVRKATTDPARAVVSAVPAGCNPVRLVLSPRGDVAYVSARTDNALLVFDVEKLLADTARARIATVPVGVAPVGVAVADQGRKVFVTSSNRFGGGRDDRQFVTVVDAGRVAEGASAVLGRIPAGAFPREIRVTSDGRTLLLTNFASGTLQVVDLTRLPLEPPPKP